MIITHSPQHSISVDHVFECTQCIFLCGGSRWVCLEPVEVVSDKRSEFAHVCKDGEIAEIVWIHATIVEGNWVGSHACGRCWCLLLHQWVSNFGNKTTKKSNNSVVVR